ncbi:MAG: insulinase family protein [Gammaproteobacteria bacterium]|nr:insulinase family protein [Gammaproteobacteria bacterium]MDH5802139.1 insulinase family protein [Gammaproteobacteria bacterium]
MGASLKNGLFVCMLTGLVAPVFATPNIQHWTSESGAQVYFVASPELPIVDLQVVFDAGSARESGKSATALMTNGMLSEGAGKLSAQQISERFDSLGAQFGNSSHRDMSVFSLRSLSEAQTLQPALELFNTILTQPSFPKKAFNREKNRLLLSIDQRKQSPGDIADEAFFKALYADHPYATLPEGDAKSAAGLTIKDLIQFYQQYYVAKNAVIAIVGNLDRDGAEQTVATVLKGLASGAKASPLADVAMLKKGEELFLQHPSSQTHIIMGSPGMKRGDQDYFSLYVGNHILGGNGLVSRLSNEIREKRGLSYSTYSYFSPMRKEGPFVMGLQTRNDSAEAALKVLKDELKKFISQGPSAEELQASKNNITGGFPLNLSSNKKILGYIAMIGFYELPLDYLDKFNAAVNAVTVESIKDAFARRIKPDNMVTVLVGDKGKQ